MQRRLSRRSDLANNTPFYFGAGADATAAALQAKARVGLIGSPDHMKMIDDVAGLRGYIGGTLRCIWMGRAGLTFALMQLSRHEAGRDASDAGRSGNEHQRRSHGDLCVRH